MSRRIAADVISIHSRRDRELIECLEGLLRLARAGKVQGLIYVRKEGRNFHRIGLLGDYCDNPIEAIGAATRVMHQINELAAGAEDEIETLAGGDAR